MKISTAPLSIMNFFFMLGLSVILAVDDTLFERNSSRFYEFLLDISPQVGFATGAFIIAVILFTAFVLRNGYVQILGLFTSGTMMLLVLSGYLLTFPSIAGVAFAIWTLATFMTIVGVLNEIQDEKEKIEEKQKEEE